MPGKEGGGSVARGASGGDGGWQLKTHTAAYSSVFEAGRLCQMM